MKKTIINSIIVGIIIGLIIWLCMDEKEEIKIESKEISKKNEIIPEVVIEEKPKKEYPKEEIITEYKGYTVAAKLEIPKIELETYVLQKYSEKALKVSVTKFWGAEPNEIGNFCIAGHNFVNKNMFRNLKNLEIGDGIFILDNKIGKVEYEVYDVYKVVPEDVSCLSQDTSNREITLITCTSNSSKRIIVKAKEKNENI